MHNIPRTVEEYRAWWAESTDVPYGFCWCGCGQLTTLYVQTAAKLGYVQGEHRRYIFGHRQASIGCPYREIDKGYETPCWISESHLTRLGYSLKRASGNKRPTHQVMYEKAYGPVPLGLELDHLCRVPSCINPSHLEAVTHAENCQRGANAKITMEIAEEIRASYADNRHTLAELGNLYGLHTDSIRNIIKFKTWR